MPKLSFPNENNLNSDNDESNGAKYILYNDVYIYWLVEYLPSRFILFEIIKGKKVNNLEKFEIMFFIMIKSILFYLKFLYFLRLIKLFNSDYKITLKNFFIKITQKAKSNYFITSCKSLNRKKYQNLNFIFIDKNTNQELQKY